MARQRGFSGRSREDLYAAAESVTEMLHQLQGMGTHRGRRDMRHHHHNYHPHHQVDQSLSWRQDRERPPSQGRGWRRNDNRGRPGPDWRRRDHYQPDAQEERRPLEPAHRPQGRQQGQGYGRQQTSYGSGDTAVVQELVTVLTQSPNFSISLLNLMEHHELPPQEVRKIVSYHGHVFRLQDEMLSLAPRLKLCTHHSSSSGCQKRELCDSLHMCPKYVLGWCKEKEACVLGHRWHTDHNLAILKRLSMEYVKYRALHALLRRSQAQDEEEGHAAGPLDVCRAYNGDGCGQAQCPNLHVCLSFVVGLTTCTRDNCQLNHDLLSPACCHLLKLHNLSVNETPRDVAMALLQDNPSLRDAAAAAPSVKASAQRQARKGNKDKSTTYLQQPGSRKDQTPAKKNKENVSSSTETESETDDSDDNKKKSRVEKPRSSKTKAKGQGRRGKGKRVSDSSSTETDSGEDADDHPDKGKKQDDTQKPLPKQQQDSASQGPRAQEAPKAAPPRTVWAHYLLGDVVVPQICYYSVESMCRDEENGCPKLHSITHFHWQVKEQNGRWFNLLHDQMTCIERAFCDPSLDGVNLPRLDPSKLDQSIRGLFILLGRDIWQADFSTSILTNSTKSKTLQLRRLCTEPVVGQSIKASTHHWYFLDINKKWVKYGNVDTAGKQQLVSSITSADIESHYQKSPQQPLNFKNSQFTFVLDLVSMKQTNQSTNMSREVRRRPEPHLPEQEDKAKPKATSDLPPHWDAMQDGQLTQLVPLNPALDEYNYVVGLLGTNVAAQVVKIDRIQCPFMWRTLQIKIQEMTALYKDATKANVQQLFHGTSHNVVTNICHENFDWRLHGKHGQNYGQGTYFGTSADVSYGYCRPDPQGLKYMFIARVAIGSIIVGNSSTVRPPINPTTSKPYESTTNNVTNPSMIIKYSEQEYCPEYLLTIR